MVHDIVSPVGVLDPDSSARLLPALSPFPFPPGASRHYGCLVADHGHLAHVCVVGQLREHKGRNIRTRYRLSCVRTPEINTVFALGRFVGESRRSHDYPIEVALFDRLFLALLVLVDVFHHERPDDPIVEKTNVTLAVPDSDAGYTDQAAHPMLVHRADEVVRTLREKGCGTRAARVPSAESTASWPATDSSTEDTSSAFPCNTLGRWSSGTTADGSRASAVTSWPCASASRIRICPVAPVAPMMRTFTPLL